MKIGISRPTQSPEESRLMLEAAQRHGFEGVQLKPVQYQEFIAAPDRFREFYGELAALASGGLIYYPGNEASTWEAQLTELLRFASAVNAEHICLCSGVYGSEANESQVQHLAEVLSAIGSQARELGLVISIHNHVASAVESEADIANLLDLLDPKLCSLTLDTAHAAKAGIQGVERLVVRFREHLLNVHLKDLDADGKFCPLGQGTLAMQPILKALEEVEYDKWLIVDEESAGVDTETAFDIAGRFLSNHGQFPELRPLS